MSYVRRRRMSISAEAGLPKPIEFRGDLKEKSEDVLEKLIPMVGKVFLCAHLDQDQLKYIVEAMEEIQVSKGTDVIIEGNDGDFFYVIENGEFEVLKNDEGT
jgi:cAMP-dependent protein kinase regulator